jgi:hypothetical protein
MTRETQIKLAKEAAAVLIPVVKTKRDLLVEVMLSQVGITEKPGGKNNVIYNTWFYGREVFDGDRPNAKYPWCCTGLAWCFNEIGKKWPRSDYNNGWSSVPNLYQYAVNHNMITDEPLPGDLVIYAWGGKIRHIGGFMKWKTKGQGIENVEFNTSFEDKGSQDNGGACAYRHRGMNLVKAFVSSEKFLI